MKKLSGYNFFIILIVSFLALLSFDFITQKAAFEEKSKRHTNIKKRSEHRIAPGRIQKRSEHRIAPGRIQKRSETRIKPR